MLVSTSVISFTNEMLRRWKVISLNRLLPVTMPHGRQNIAKVGSGELRDIEDCILVTEADYSTASDLFEKGEIEEIRDQIACVV